MYNKERKTKYAIRKLAVATVSLAIGTTVAVPAIVDSGQVAHAEEQGGTPAKAKYKVTYEFMTGTPGYELPTEINALLPDATESEDGYLITPQPPKQTTYVDAKNNGVWTFYSYDRANKVVNKGDVKFTGIWVFTGNVQYDITYKFKSITPGRELPAEINNFIPNDPRKKASYGEKFTAYSPEKTFYEEADGYWGFVGYETRKLDDETYTQKIGVDGTGTMVGMWEFFKKDEVEGDASKFAPQLYHFSNIVNTTPEYEMPDEIKQAYPTHSLMYRGRLSSLKERYKIGEQKIGRIQTPIGYWGIDTLKGGNGSVDGLSYANGTHYEYSVYQHHSVWDFWKFNVNPPMHNYVSGTPGVYFPPGLYQKPWASNLEWAKDKSLKKGVVVTPKAPDSLTYKDDINHGVWTFQGFDKEKAIYGVENVVFTGTWTFKFTLDNPEVTEVDDNEHLTTEEKTKVERALRVANKGSIPIGTTIDIADNGDVTLTYPYGSKDTIPGIYTVVKKGTTPAPIVNKVGTDDTKITGTGVAGSKIEVTLPDGTTKKTTTVKPDGKWEVDLDNPLEKGSIVRVTQEAPGKKVSAEVPTTVISIADKTTPNNPAVTKVDNPAQLTQDEKDKVVDEVKKANPSLPAGTTVTVGDNGDVTITYPDKSKDTIPGTSTVSERETSAKPTVDKVDTDDLKVTGTGVAGSKIVVTLPNGDTKTTTVKPDGTWEVTLDNPLAKDGEVKVTQEETGKKVSPIAPTTVVPTTAEATTPKLPEVTEVDDPTQLTQDEKGKVEKAVKDANPTFPAGTTIIVYPNGDVTITYPDKSKDTIPGINTVVKKGHTPAPVVDKVDTDDTKITGEGVVGATVEVELPDGTKKTTVVKPDGKWEVPLANPLPKDSVVKVTQTTPGKKVSEKVPTKVVETIADKTTPNNPAITKVDNPAQLTQDEKDKVVDEVKKVNPSLPAGTTVTVDNNGDVTITYPDKSKDTIPGTSTVAEKETSAKPTVDKVDTDDLKVTGTGVAGSKIVVTLPNGDTKTTTVKPDGKWEVDLDNPLAKDGEVKVTQEEAGKKVSPIAPTTVVPTTAEATTPNVPAVTEVENKTQLTQEEKGKVEKAVKDANPTFPAGTTVTVDNNGDVTITYPDKSKDTIPGTSTVVEKAKTPKIADTTTPKLPEVTEVEDPTQLTQDEKDKVVDKVKKANPGLPAGTTVTVGNNGDVTITYPDKSKNTIPGIHTVVKKGHSPAPVVDKVDTDDTKITGEGVVGATVEVELPDGTKKTTVVKPDGKWEVGLDNPLPKGSVVKVTQTVPGKKVSEKVPTTVVSIADNTNPNVPTVTEVENKTKLTQGEKDKVVDEVKKANPGLPAGTTITVADNGDVTITYPDNSIDIIPGTKTVTEKTKVPGPAPKPTPQPQPGQKTIAEQITPKTPEVTEVGNKTKLTQGEKGKVEEAVKKANPGLPAGTKITVADNGEVTITYPDGSVDTISGESTVKEKVKPAGEKAKALPNTGLTANNAVVAGLSILAMAALLAARRKNNK